MSLKTAKARTGLQAHGVPGKIDEKEGVSSGYGKTARSLLRDLRCIQKNTTSEDKRDEVVKKETAKLLVDLAKLNGY